MVFKAMSENTTEIYVVSNVIGPLEDRNVYVGTSKETAQEVCDANQSKENLCFIQVWEDGEQQYVTRVLEDEDICVGDIELKKGHIILMDNREDNWE